MSSSHSTRYAAIVANLARQSIAMAEDCTPHAARAGEVVIPCVRLLPLAQAVVDQVTGKDVAGDTKAIDEAMATLGEAAAAATPRFTDGMGHSREVYQHLSVALARRAVDEEPRHADALAAAAQWASDRLDQTTSDVSVLLWRAAVARPHIAAKRVVDVVESVLAEGDDTGSLQRQTPEDSPDHWTFRELAGLHALAALAEAMDRDAWRRRAREIAVFHQGHTQPDYTTYQPWAVAVFAGDEETAMFAEQQLHDVESHLNLQGGGGAVIPALLLSDAAAMLSG